MDREKYLWNNFRLTPEDWDAISAYQNHVCAICGKPQEPTKHGARRLSVDHDHATGEIRCLACSKCNPLLGKLENAYKRYGLHKIPGNTLTAIIRGFLRVLENPPARLALGRTVVGYPGRINTKEHRAWIKRELGIKKTSKKRKH